MSINLVDYEARARVAVQNFWQTRADAATAQAARGVKDTGERASVTSGKNLDGFVKLVKELVLANGLTEFSVHTKKSLVPLPGFFRPTKEWDLIVVHQGILVAALELKSQIGPSFGNNFNNRCEEVLGSATDLRTAFREKAFRESSWPFVGYLILVEDCPAVHTPVRGTSPHFPTFQEFAKASYAQRYELLCQKLVQERLYDAATLLLSPRDTGLINGEYRELSELTGLQRFVAGLRHMLLPQQSQDKSQ
jgi:hypothetical protein